MHLEPKIIGGLLMGLLFAVCIILMGLFIVRPMLNGMVTAKFKLFPITLTAYALPLGIAFYYLDKYLDKYIPDGNFSALKTLTPVLAFYAVFIVGWVSSYISRRRGSGV